MKYPYTLLILCITLFTACHSGTKATYPDADTLVMRHAQYLTLIAHPDYTEVQIRSPWDENKLLQTVFLQPENLEHSENSDNTEYTKKSSHSSKPIIPLPRRALSFTATHSSLIEELGMLDALAGVCEAEYIANPRIREALEAGRISNIGSAMTPDRERIIGLDADLILLSPYENASTYGNLESLGIPIIQCADYMETSALGRSEWIRFYGRLFGKGHEADSLFSAIEAQYHVLKAITDSLPAQQYPTILFDTQNGSAWYVPGGRSTMAQLIADAGGRYLFNDNAKSGSVPLSFETVLERGQQADVWLIRYNNSRQRMRLPHLGQTYQPYTLFSAYQNGNVYGCNSAELIFYEETPFHPERLLRDYIKILHPALLPSDTLHYFHKL